MSRAKNAYASDRRQSGRRWYDGVLGKVIGDLPPETEAYWRRHPEELEQALIHILNRNVDPRQVLAPRKKRA